LQSSAKIALSFAAGAAAASADAELQALAQKCEVRFDLPRVTRQPFRLAPDLGARLHLSEAEQGRV